MIHIFKISDGIQISVTFFGVSVFVISIHKVKGWFRVFGYGLSWKNKNLWLSFSERYGHSDYIVVGKYMITFLSKRY